MAEVIDKPVTILVRHKMVLDRCLELGEMSLKRALNRVQNPAILKALKDEMAEVQELRRAVNSL